MAEIDPEVLQRLRAIHGDDCPSDSELERYASAADETTRSGVTAKHLRGCPRCTNRLIEIRELMAEAQGAEPPESLQEAVLAALSEKQPATNVHDIAKRRDRRQAGWARRARRVIGAVAACAVIAIAALLTRTNPERLVVDPIEVEELKSERLDAVESENGLLRSARVLDSLPPRVFSLELLADPGRPNTSSVAPTLHWRCEPPVLAVSRLTVVRLDTNEVVEERELLTKTCEVGSTKLTRAVLLPGIDYRWSITVDTTDGDEKASARIRYTPFLGGTPDISSPAGQLAAGYWYDALSSAFAEPTTADREALISRLLDDADLAPLGSRSD